MTFQCDILGQMWYLIVSIPKLCQLPRGCLQFVIVVFPDHTHLLLFLLIFISEIGQGNFLVGYIRTDCSVKDWKEMANTTQHP